MRSSPHGLRKARSNLPQPVARAFRRDEARRIASNIVKLPEFYKTLNDYFFPVSNTLPVLALTR
jgi:hypothetical protein